MSNKTITILHLSDIQFGANHRFGVTVDTFDGKWDTLIERLKLDLDEMKREYELHPDLVIMSGDLAEWGKKSEFEQVFDFSVQLAEYLKLGRERFVIVPGNHDINRKLCSSYFDECEGNDESPIEPFWKKWESFKKNLFDRFFQDQPNTCFTEETPWTMFEIDGLKVVVAGINSTMKESHKDEDHYGHGGEEQYRWFQGRLREFQDKEWLRIGVLHHNLQRGAKDDDENLRDSEDLKRILLNSLNLVLHGHVHAGGVGWFTPKCPIIATGSAALKEDQRPGEIHNQYQFIRVSADGFERWCRAYSPEPGQKKWVGDTHAILGGNEWHHEEKVIFEKVSNALPSTVEIKNPIEFRDLEDDRLLQRAGHIERRRDDFIDLVSDVCRVRAKGALIELVASKDISYLKVTVSQQGIVETYPVGVSDGLPSLKTLTNFYERVVQKYRSASSGAKAYFVCKGAPLPNDEIRILAREYHIFLYSFDEYQGLIDFRAYLARQNEKLANDLVYPLDIYVPQQMHFEYGSQRHEASDAMAKVLEWLTDEKGRFILLLGDFGTGKTFLLHNLTYWLADSGSTRIPVLIKMRDLEKGRTLNELIAQHLSRAGMEEIDLSAFRYMLNTGRIVLLFDGFDELALRVTYDNIQAHFESLLEAASGANAKVIVTSRTQHFKSDDQARNTALGERFDAHPNRRIAWLEKFSPEQVLMYLKSSLGNDTAAERRYNLLDDVKDLLGLSANPRMLSFIAALPEEDLIAAKEGDGEISAAKLYEMLLTRWINGEHVRLAPTGAQPLINQFERWDAATKLALALWYRIEPTINLSELADEVRKNVMSLFERSIDPDVVTHQVASGTLLIRDEEGNFGFIHQSILEWLVANDAARELKANETSSILEHKEMSTLMVDFLISLAGETSVFSWAQLRLSNRLLDNSGKLNAMRCIQRLGKKIQLPARLEGENLQGTDFSRQDYAGANFCNANLNGARLLGTILDGADLSDAVLRDSVLICASLRGANLSNADLGGARMMGADLQGSRMDGARLKRAKLIGARYDVEHIVTADTWGAAMTVENGISPYHSFRSAVQCFAWHPFETILAYAVASNVSLYDIATGLEIRRMEGHGGLVLSVAFSLDGKYVVGVYRDKSLCLWETATGTEIRRLKGHGSFVHCVAISPDGTLVVGGSQEKFLSMWSTDTGCEIHRLQGQGDRVQCATFSADGAMLASGARDKTVYLWETATGNEIRRLEGHDSWVQSVAFSPDGALVVSGSRDKTLRLWETATGREIRRMDGHSSVVQSVVFSPDGALIVSSSRDSVQLWETATGRVIRQMEGHNRPIRSASLSPDGAFVVSSCVDKTICFWETMTGREIRHIEGYHGFVLSVAFSSNGTLVVSGSSDNTVRLWETTTGREIRRMEGHGNWVQSVAFSPDGTLVVSGSEDNSVRLWETATGREVRCMVGHSGGVQCVAFSPDGAMVASGSEDNTVQLWRTATGRKIRSMKGHGDRVQSLAFSPDGALVVSGSGDNSVRLWETATGREIRRMEGLSDWIQCVAFSPDGTMVASGSDDNTVRLWETATGREIRHMEGHGNWVCCVAFSSDGARVVSASDDNTVRLWETATGREIRRMEGHGGGVQSVAFSPDGALVVSGAYDNTVRLWRTDSSEYIASFVHSPDGWVTYLPDGRYKFGGDVGGQFWHAINLCRFEIGELDQYWPTQLRMADDEPLLS